MKRFIAATGAAFLLMGTALPAAALTLPYTATGSYRNSTYHKNLTQLTETGDEAFDTVAAALSQLGYHEGNGTKELHGKGTGSGNYTEYGRAFGKVDGTYGYAWCAVFASWCLRVAGAGDSAGGGFSSCSLWLAHLREAGQYSSRASGYTPKPGDLIFFRSAGAGRASDHVGVVRYVKGGRVYTVEGNSSNRVAAHDYALSDTYIVGYGKPRYEGERLEKNALAMEDKVAGFYVVTNGFVNVRAGAGTSFQKLGSLSLGQVVTVAGIEAGWGRISYNGGTAYISLDYADFVSPLRYTVTYAAAGEKWEVECFSFSSLTASAAPEIAGSRFLHWADAHGHTYETGATLPAGDLALTAVYEVIPPEPEMPPAVTPPEESAPEELPGGAPEALPPTMAPEELPEGLPEPLPPTGELPPTDMPNRAAAHAGVVSGLLSAALGIWWYIRRFLT
ncbi:MAG: CHAP domain-containing protein [Clostridia bacterium]|nr:CHAP domain-containing protein [Clostridia bacterium]